ncbi:hypothetical protein DEU56DRAFT_873780 [Suillus clintonianus]|uniref:uncharacterized protein n=1 Tax=Suillus clintonianus TaxID=1904413 RepID=UPI001B86AB0C|nr:uncharacterized protein DEU56DRAFT_873780 [Suillus clintonianus]KAG2121427.1 hypothetical protein DEU56DRAFT_873780 [Suillus clintonianus]
MASPGLQSHYDDANPEEREPLPQLDDIKVDYHPHSQIPSTIHHFADFSRTRPTEASVPRNHAPWEPFRTRLDFEVAELALEAALTAEQTNRLLSLVHRSAHRDETFTLQNHDEVRELWSTASQRFTPFQVDVVSVLYQKKVHEFDMHYRPLWEWALDMLRDRRLAPHFVFDAQRLYKFNGTRFVRFIDEPWTANAFWDAQSRLPPEAKPLAFILYADKAKLSSFGTQKAYPIVCRIANLPVEIRNGAGIGGGRIVGWLPIVSEDPEHAGKSSFVDFKTAVWHESFLKLLESVIQISRTGYWFECGDAIRRLLWPLILILSADYEEQCIMALIRGLKGKFPCPICLVPRDEQSVLSHELRLRTSAESEETLQLARAKKSKKEREKLLKTYSLRDVENAFWRMMLTDIHRALSFDRMHVYHGGLWRHHLWRELQFWILELGREAVVQMDACYDAFPRWSNLTHFSKVVGVDFNDSSHHEDISKMAIFAAQRILRRSQSKLGYLLLRCIHHYIDLDIYAGFEVHTEDSIVAGRRALREFSVLMEMHGPVRDIYHNRTNFKNVATQILRYDHWLLTLTSMRSELDELDEYNRKADLPTTEDADTENPAISVAPAPYTHVKLGSAQGDISFASLEQSHADDGAFVGFRIKLNAFLNTFFPSNDIPLPNGKRIHLQADNKITGYKYLQVNYESMVDWRQCKDLLRCNPEFFGSPRYDCVMVQTDNQPFFARLIFMFGCSIGETNLSLALIHPYDVGIGVRSKHDTDLGLWRVRAKLRSSPEFISVRSIIRGAALASDPGRQGDYFVIDTVDADMFLRVKSLQVA